MVELEPARRRGQAEVQRRPGPPRRQQAPGHGRVEDAAARLDEALVEDPHDGRAVRCTWRALGGLVVQVPWRPGLDVEGPAAAGPALRRSRGLRRLAAQAPAALHLRRRLQRLGAAAALQERALRGRLRRAPAAHRADGIAVVDEGRHAHDEGGAVRQGEAAEVRVVHVAAGQAGPDDDVEAEIVRPRAGPARGVEVDAGLHGAGAPAVPGREPSAALPGAVDRVLFAVVPPLRHVRHTDVVEGDAVDGVAELPATQRRRGPAVPRDGQLQQHAVVGLQRREVELACEEQPLAALRHHADRGVRGAAVAWGRGVQRALHAREHGRGPELRRVFARLAVLRAFACGRVQSLVPTAPTLNGLQEQGLLQRNIGARLRRRVPVRHGTVDERLGLGTDSGAHGH
mmetsp:Transcript_36953/g.105106  ORF Transcript_36953/g.105106 Transcript_36953/m.105106 type:complete len:400 (-) Transcript_36953:977-2176(-)